MLRGGLVVPPPPWFGYRKHTDLITITHDLITIDILRKHYVSIIFFFEVH